MENRGTGKRASRADRREALQVRSARQVIGQRCGMDQGSAQRADVHQMISIGYEQLGNYGGSPSERQEIAPVERRLALLRAVAVLEQHAAENAQG